MTEDAEARLEALYREIVDLGERARGWFDGPGQRWRETLPVDGQAAVAIESLGTTARLLGMMAWLLDPAHSRGAKPAFVLDADGDDLPAGSPLAGTPGGDVAVTARQLVTRMRAMVAAAAAEDDR